MIGIAGVVVSRVTASGVGGGGDVAGRIDLSRGQAIGAFAQRDGRCDRPITTDCDRAGADRGGAVAQRDHGADLAGASDGRAVPMLVMLSSLVPLSLAGARVRPAGAATVVSRVTASGPEAAEMLPAGST